MPITVAQLAADGAQLGLTVLLTLGLSVSLDPFGRDEYVARPARAPERGSPTAVGTFA
ncbi:MAG: hypothetical protein L0H79_11095 [Intrasporangium sp.]|uniref:hypothetical protein n=1 Tax=Intrasporangium sp. TaxID=1925024 RepID=UPI002647458F|nr:hypothetical protein [Intrasporangium sp.]MDN5796281.1 hypothetical protein [Intrasporangium sp.]